MSTNIKTWWEREGYSSDPGAYLTRESARDAEIADLRQKLAETQEELNEWRFTNRVDELQRQLDAALAATAPTVTVDEQEAPPQQSANAQDEAEGSQCWCHTCRPVTISDCRMVLCPACGNKRCPHANDHRSACTDSNEPGQAGSAYPAAPSSADQQGE